MEFKEFIGKVVLGTGGNFRYVLIDVSAVEIEVRAEKPNANGYYPAYCFSARNGDPFSEGELVFEDASLNEPFKKAFAAYQKSEAARGESYLYYLMNGS